MKSLKKVLCLLLSLAVIVSTFGAMPALAAGSDEELIMNFDLGAGSGTKGDYSAKDQYTNSYAKTYSWSNTAEVRNVDGKTALYN